MSFICGSPQNQVEEEDDFELLWGAAAPTASPKRCASKVSRRLSFCKKNKNSKNPYADLGLDKFSALLADLDHKRQEIFIQKGSEDISLVHFVYSEDNVVKPVVIKGKFDKKQEIINPVFEATKVKAPSSHNSKLEATFPSNKSISHEVKGAKMAVESDEKSTKVIKKGNNGIITWNLMKLETWRRPVYYLPLFLVLIMIFLALFGKSVAILCTSIGWYVISSINESGESKSKSNTNTDTKGPKKMKQEYARKISEKVSTPRSILSGAVNNEEDQGRRRSF